MQQKKYSFKTTFFSHFYENSIFLDKQQKHLN